VRLDDVIPAWARVWVLKLDVQGREPQALAGARALLAARRVHALVAEWWPAGIVAQGTADGGAAALEALVDGGAACFDMGTHESNALAGMGIDRPSRIRDWVAALLAVPRTPPPGGDPSGAFDDVLCQLAVDEPER